MPRSTASVLTLAVVLVLQLALGVLDSACMTRMAIGGVETSAAADGGDMTACDLPSGDRAPSAPDRAPTHEGEAPAVCHALASCGVSFLGAAGCHAAPVVSTLGRVESVAAIAPPSVTFPPDLPPPRA